ncbi:MAG: class I SAM-dependent methyltransferase [Verrucomicrobia bacterium]|nr:class I SAM-dependent methyltransferase [Verrucomicrobiota bacterium]
MVTVRHYGQAGTMYHEPALVLFQTQWQLHRKAVEHNYLFHDEAYSCLHRVLVDEAAQPFRFLDVACGDASATVQALRGTRVASYQGIDLSQPALELASEALGQLACPVTLHRRDLVEALNDHPEPVDVVWIGLALHHFPTPMKLTIMRQVRTIVSDQGLFLIYESASPDGEDRDGWLDRWDAQKPRWTAFTHDEWEAGRAHVHASDFPETTSGWCALGREAGFRQVRELFVAPTNLLRLYCFRG